MKIWSLIQCVWWADPDCSMYSYSVFSENKAQLYSSGSPQPGLNQQNGRLATLHTASCCVAKQQHNKNSLHCSQLKKKSWLLRNAKVTNVGGKNHRAIGYLHVCLYSRRPRISRVNLCHFPKGLCDISWFMQQILLLNNYRSVCYPVAVRIFLLHGTVITKCQMHLERLFEGFCWISTLLNEHFSAACPDLASCWLPSY